MLGRPFLREGDILGHEPMGIVDEVGERAAQHLQPGDRVVVPFNIACGECWLCRQGLQSQCETTQNRKWKKGASLFGYSHLYGGVPGGQAEYLRVPMAHYGPIKVPEGPPDERYLFLSDVLPTAWQAVAYADGQPGATIAVYGLGPIGQMCCRIALHRGAERVIGVDHVRNGSPWRSGTASRRSTSRASTARPRRFARSRTGAGWTRRSTRSGWRPTPGPSSALSRRRSSCRTGSERSSRRRDH